jgi:hypothetical protein
VFDLDALIGQSGQAPPDAPGSFTVNWPPDMVQQQETPEDRRARLEYVLGLARGDPRWLDPAHSSKLPVTLTDDDRRDISLQLAKERLEKNPLEGGPSRVVEALGKGVRAPLEAAGILDEPDPTKDPGILSRAAAGAVKMTDEPSTYLIPPAFKALGLLGKAGKVAQAGAGAGFTAHSGVGTVKGFSAASRLQREAAQAKTQEEAAALQEEADQAAADAILGGGMTALAPVIGSRAWLKGRKAARTAPARPTPEPEMRPPGTPEAEALRPPVQRIEPPPEVLERRAPEVAPATPALGPRSIATHPSLGTVEVIDIVPGPRSERGPWPGEGQFARVRPAADPMVQEFTPPTLVPLEELRATSSPPAPRLAQKASVPQPPEPPRPPSEPPPPPPPAETAAPGEAPGGDPAAKLIRLLGEAKPVRAETAKLQHQERGRRAAELAAIRATPQGKTTLFKYKSALKGELPRAEFEPVEPALKDAEVTELFDRITRHPELRDYEAVRASDALATVLTGGRVPQRGEIALLERVFGEEFAGALLKKRATGEKLKEVRDELINLPRVLTTAFDMSMPFRQGAVLTASHPVKATRAFGTMFRAAVSEKAFKAVEHDINSRPNAPLYDRFKLYFARRYRTQELGAREEQFMSGVAERFHTLPIIRSIPIVKQAAWLGSALIRGSNRAATTYLNKLRADVFDSIAAQYRKGGMTPETHPQVYEGLATWLNMASGRGKLPFGLERSSALLNGVFFSPRLLASRFQILNPFTYGKLPGPVRLQAMKDVASLAGAGLTILGISKLGGAKVSDDWRDADFGKIRVGDTRIDVWGGFQQWIRFYAQVVGGERRTSAGEIKKFDNTGPYPENLITLGTRFVRSKLSPQAGLAWDWAAGQNMIGEEFRMDKELADRVTPMFARDYYEAIKEHGLAGAALAAPSFFGVGVQTYKRRP